MSRFQIYSAQTGIRFGPPVEADSEEGALDAYAGLLGYADRREMWNANGGALEALSAYQVVEQQGRNA